MIIMDSILNSQRAQKLAENYVKEKGVAALKNIQSYLSNDCGYSFSFSKFSIKIFLCNKGEFQETKKELWGGNGKRQRRKYVAIKYIPDSEEPAVINDENENEHRRK